MSKWTGLLKSAAALLLVFAGRILCASSAPSEGLQEAAVRALQGRAGALVVADVVSGEILAAQDMTVAAQKLARPGSTVKPFVLMALLEADKLNAKRKLLCRRVLRIGGEKMDCPHSAAIAELDAEEAIAYSCNLYFAQAATRLSAPELAQALRHAGLDGPGGFTKNEARGRIDTPRDAEMLQLEALGDRGIEVTPLELLAAYRKLALARRNNTALAVDLPVFAGLEASVAYGMAHAAKVEGVAVAGKTGTVGSQETARPHGFFVGYAPADRPQIAVVVYLEQGRGVDAAAAAQVVFAEFARNGFAR